MKLNVWVMVVGLTSVLAVGVDAARAEPAPAPPVAAAAVEVSATDEAVAEPPAAVMDADGVPETTASLTVKATVRAPAPAPAPAPVATAEVEVNDTDVAALEDFDPYLNDYGVWVDDPRYGTVWVPHPHAVGARFAPYVSRGHWSLTATNDWIWESDYPFGWVVFHYGRWVFTPDNGWSWIPGRRYSHAWVTFRVSDDPYIGWAPMPPSYAWRRGVAVPLGFAVAAAFVFAPIDYAFYPSVQSYVIYDRHRVSRLIGRSYYYAPPGRRAGFYYSPPVSRIPPQARPTRRAVPNPRALELRQPQRRVTAAAPARVGASARSAVRPVNGNAFRVRSMPQQGVQRSQTVERRSAPQRRVSPRDNTVRRSNTPERVAPQRTVPQRSAPQRSAPQRSAPQRSAPQRNATPPRSAPQRMNLQQQRNTSQPKSGAFQPSASNGPRPEGRAKATPREVPKAVQSPETKGRPAPEPRTKPVKPQSPPARQAAPPRRESAPAPRRESRPERSNVQRSHGDSSNRGGGSHGRRR